MTNCSIKWVSDNLKNQKLPESPNVEAFIKELEKEIEKFRVKPDLEMAREYERKGYKKENIARLLEKQMELDFFVKIYCIKEKYKGYFNQDKMHSSSKPKGSRAVKKNSFSNLYSFSIKPILRFIVGEKILKG